MAMIHTMAALVASWSSVRRCSPQPSHLPGPGRTSDHNGRPFPARAAFNLL